MKKMTYLVLIALMLSTSAAMAALTEAQLAPAAVQEEMAKRPAATRGAFAQEVFSAIANSPADDATKVSRLVAAAKAAIRGASKGGGGVAVIAQMYNTVPVDLLQAVSDLMTPSFSQAANNLSDAQYDEWCKRIVSASSAYIETSGADSSTVRMSIMSAMFSKGSNDPDRTRAVAIAALPEAVRDAAAIYIVASEKGDTEALAAGAGVDEIAETPEQPAPAQAADAETAPEENDDGTPLPILARIINDNIGQAYDNIAALNAEWATGNDPFVNPTTPFVGGGASVIALDGSATTGIPGQGAFGDQQTIGEKQDPPSPLYGNQR